MISTCFLWLVLKQQWPCMFSLYFLPPFLPVCVLFVNINAYVFAHRLRVAVVCRQLREMCAPCNMCDKLSGDMCIHVRVPAHESATWGFSGMDYFTLGHIQRTQPSVSHGGERDHCCGPDECHRCLRKQIHSRLSNRNTLATTACPLQTIIMLQPPFSNNGGIKCISSPGLASVYAQCCL